MILYNLKGVIMDLDGTLVNSLKIYDEAHQKIFEKYNIKVDGTLDSFGAPPRELVEAIIKKHNLNIGSEDILREAEDIIIEEYLDKIKFNVGAKQILNYFREKKYKLSIVTSNTKRLVYELLKHLGILNLFDVIITGDDVKEQKPEPECYIKAVKMMNLLPFEVLAIEDSIYGIIAAKRAGINVIGIASGVNKKRELISAGATMVFKNLKELYDYFIEEDNNNNK
ncbi:MAG: HAD family hydrolase [Nanopusillaceae archaeon]|jgi:HAD superfamily hydrolase (TIGR01509 family)